MGVWSTLLKYGGKAMKGVGTATATTGKSMGKAVLHPSQTLRGAGQAVKTATIGGAVGYVGWEKLTTDKKRGAYRERCGHRRTGNEYPRGDGGRSA